MVENRFYGGILSNSQIHFRSDSTKKYFKESKRTMSDIHPLTFHLGNGVAGENKLGQMILDTGFEDRSAHFAIF